MEFQFIFVAVVAQLQYFYGPTYLNPLSPLDKRQSPQDPQLLHLLTLPAAIARGVVPPSPHRPPPLVLALGAKWWERRFRPWQTAKTWPSTRAHLWWSKRRQERTGTMKPPSSKRRLLQDWGEINMGKDFGLSTASGVMSTASGDWGS